jgi:hypothetical protein
MFSHGGIWLRLRLLQLRSDLPSTCSPSFRIFGASTSMDFLRKQCRRLRISFAFDLFGCVHSPTISLALSSSLACNLTDFNKLFRIHFRILPHLLVSLRFRPPASYRIVRPSMSSASLNQYLSLYTWSPGVAPSGKGSRPRRQKKTTKTTKPKTATTATLRKRSRSMHRCSAQS